MSLYTAFRNTDWWANLVGSASLLNYTTSRPVGIGITEQPNYGSTYGSLLSLAGEGGYELHSGSIGHGPVAGFVLQQARIAGFTESGSFTSLSFAAQLRNSEVGLLGYQTNFDAGILHPFVQVVWDHEFDPLNRVVTASLTTIAAPSYSLPAVVVGRDWAAMTVGTKFGFSPKVDGACLIHGAARANEHDQLRRPHWSKLRLRSGGACADRPQELMGSSLVVY